MLRPALVLAVAFLALAPALTFASVAGASGITLTDSVERKVDLAGPAERVAPAGDPAQVLLQALAPKKLIGLVQPFKPEHAVYVDEAIANLPQIPLLSRTKAPGDIAAVAALKPSLVVDYGSTTERYVAAIEAIEAELKVPALLFAGTLGGAPATSKLLGHAIGEDARGNAVATALSDALAQVAAFADLPDSARVPVYLARGSDGLNAARGGGAFDEAIRLAGGRNVVVRTGGGGAFQTMTVDAVAALKPAVVIVAESEASHGALRDALPKSTRFFVDNGEPYKVLTGPPSINRMVGVLALAAALHPDDGKISPEAARTLETLLFPVPPGIAEPAPLQQR